MRQFRLQVQDPEAMLGQRLAPGETHGLQPVGFFGIPPPIRDPLDAKLLAQNAYLPAVGAYIENRALGA
jgi:hypothetical protein